MKNTQTPVRKILIVGGYGNFGKRIAESLSALRGITIFIGGRDMTKALELCEVFAVTGAHAQFEALKIDIDSQEFSDDLRTLCPDLVIHTGGPFQGQDYRVPKACIAIGSHYIDLADDRRFVCDIASLNELAQASDTLIVSGASSVPGLSSTVIDHFKDQFSKLDQIDFAIAPGNQAERGEATVRGILSYTGHPFTALSNGNWREVYGWMSSRQMDFGPVIGKRWLANVDIPDLELFPERYLVNTVRFQAGLELFFLHGAMVLMAWLAKVGLVRDWSIFASQIYKLSDVFKGLGTDIGGMQIHLTGLDQDNKLMQIKWLLTAENGVGPYIPTLSAIILAKKLIKEGAPVVGAMPCLGMYQLAEFDAEATTLGIYHQTEISYG